MNMYETIIENGRKKISEEAIFLNARLRPEGPLADRIAHARETISRFLTELELSFHGGKKPPAVQPDYARPHVEVYTDSVVSLVSTLAKVQRKSKNKVTPQEDISLFSDDQIRALVFEFSSQLQDVIGLFAKDRGQVTTDVIHDAEIPLRRYNVQFIEELKSDPEFLSLHDRPVIFQTALVNNVGNPRLFLRKELLKRMKNDPRFSVIKQREDIFRIAAKDHMDNPVGFLEKLLVDYDVLMQDGEFELLLAVPKVFVDALISEDQSPEGPKKYLRKILQYAQKLETNEEFAELRDIPEIFLHFAAHYNETGYDELRTLMFIIQRLKLAEEFSELLDTPEIFKYAAIRHRKDPIKFLRAVVRKIKTLEAQEELASLRHIPNIYRYAATMYSLKDALSFLGKTAADAEKGIEPAPIDRAALLAEITKGPLSMLPQKDQKKIFHMLP